MSDQEEEFEDPYLPEGEHRRVGRSARYRDTSWLIHRQWRLKQSVAFPSVEAGCHEFEDNRTGNSTVPSSSIHCNGNKSVPSSPVSKSQHRKIKPVRSARVKRVTPQVHNADVHSKHQNGATTTGEHMHGGGGQVTENGGVARVTHKSRQNHTMLQTSTPVRPRGAGEMMMMIPSGDDTYQRPPSADMQLNYITERLLALWFPSESAIEARHGLTRAAALLRNKHGDHYMVFNLSPRSVARAAVEEDPGEVCVRELGWARGLAPPLERLCALCKEVDAWLCAGPQRLAVLSAQSYGGRERLGVAVSAFMHYSLICGGEEQALDRYAMSRFIEDRVGDFQQPSNKRYVGYFSGLLSGNIRINAQPMYLTHVTLIGAPAYEVVDPSPSSSSSLMGSAGGGCRLFIKVYQGLVPVHTSPVYHLSGSTRRLTVALEKSLQLRGDVMLRCYHRHPPQHTALLAGEGRELIFSCQFHTCAVSDYTLTFKRQELDHACLDLRFPLDGAVELTFSPNPTPRHPSPAPTPAVPVDHSPDPITRWDSLDTLLTPVDASQMCMTPPHHQLRVGTSPVSQPLGVDTSDSQHSPGYTPGPLDGSLYATVSKKSPVSSGHSPSTNPTTGGAGGGVHSPHTVSMDSGISSAGNGQPAASQGAAGVTDHHKMLDQLLTDMLLTVENIPDLPPPTPKNMHTSPIAGIDDSLKALQEFQFASSRSPDMSTAQPPPPHQRATSPQPATHQATLVSSQQQVEDQRNIPYHARQDSQPFTYGIPPPDSNMATRTTFNGDTTTLNHVHPRLASPSLVRKASGKSSTSSPASSSFNFNNNNNNNNTWSPASSKNNKSWNSTISTISTTTTENHSYNNTGSLLMPSTNGRRGKSSLDDDDTRDLLDGYPDGTMSSTTTTSYNGSSGLTWLQRQQQKLRERREYQVRSERHPHETRLLTELRTVQHRILKPGMNSMPRRPSTEDGYASDTTLLLSGLDDDLPLTRNTPSPHYASPLVIHTGGVAPPASHNYHKSGAGLSAPSSPLLPTRSSSRDRTLRYHGPSQSHHQELATIMSGVKPLSRQKSDTSFDRERPFVAVKRAHDVSSRRVMDSQTAQSPPVSPLSLLASQPPLGQLPAAYYTIYSRTQHQQPLTNGDHYQPCKPAITSPHYLHSPSSLDDWDGRGSPRPQTPAFPVHPRTPYSNNSQTPQPGDSPSSGLPPKSPTALRRERSMSPGEHPGTPSLYGSQSRRSSVHSSGGETVTQEVSPAHVKFVRDTSRYWYKPNISREEAIAILREQVPGTFVVRDSNSFPGAFGLALKVAVPPPTPLGGTSSRQGGSSDPSSELVRHFLIEPTSRGVKLKGCANEPVFSSLSALVYQHSVTTIALPCRLLLPDKDVGPPGMEGRGTLSLTQQLLTQGAACNVLYLMTVDTESLTGPQAVRRAITVLFASRPLPKATIVHFKVASQGITLTDNKRTLFFRRHYPVATISFCGLDPDDHRWSQRSEDTGMPISSNRCFGFVARKPASQLSDNQCHLFAELEPEQPATAIVNFVSKVMMSGNQSPSLGKANIV